MQEEMNKQYQTEVLSCTRIPEHEGQPMYEVVYRVPMREPNKQYRYAYYTSQFIDDVKAWLNDINVPFEVVAFQSVGTPPNSGYILIIKIEMT